MIIQLLAIFVVDWGVTAKRNRRMLGLTGKEFRVRLLFFLQAFLFQSQLLLLILYSCYLRLLYLDLMLVRKFLLQGFNHFLLPVLFSLFALLSLGRLLVEVTYFCIPTWTLSS